MSLSETMDALWDRYRNQGDVAARGELLSRYLGLVHHAARQFVKKVGHAVELDDLVSAGTLGLVQALEGFDLTRGLGFSTYAVQRIRGAILDELRSRDWLPRGVRVRLRKLYQTVDELERRLGRPPAPAEIAQALDVDLETYFRDWASHDGRHTLPLDGAAPQKNGAGVRLEEALADPNARDPDAELARAERAALLREAIATLRPRERTVLALYYYEELNLRQIGEVLHVTESRVSQIRASALERLRGYAELAETAG